MSKVLFGFGGFSAPVIDLFPAVFTLFYLVGCWKILTWGNNLLLLDGHLTGLKLPPQQGIFFIVWVFCCFLTGWAALFAKAGLQIFFLTFWHFKCFPEYCLSCTLHYTKFEKCLQRERVHLEPWWSGSAWQSNARHPGFSAAAHCLDWQQHKQLEQALLLCCGIKMITCWNHIPCLSSKAYFLPLKSLVDNK